MQKTYSHMVDDSHLEAPARSQTISELSHLLSYRTPRASIVEMTQTLKDVIEKHPTGLRCSLARKFFQELISAVYLYHKVENQPHCNIRTDSILVSHNGAQTLDRPIDRECQNGPTLDSVRYLPHEALR